MAKQSGESVPIIDLFAGSGGLSEGFSAFQTPDGCSPFHIALSIEKEHYAHRTLKLRSFFRQFPPGKAPDEYYDYLRQADEPEPARRERLFDAWPEEAKRAEAAALEAELGREETASIRKRITSALGGHDEFILLGGPPCQPYSLMGRSRNSGNPNYKATEDKRQRLYVEYLQVLADHHPAVFIMENVKGLLSATLANQRIFEQILDDLRSPCEAVLRENRDLADGRRRTHYNLFAVGCNGNENTEDLRRFIVRMEKHGIPQARHRLIVLGIRDDLGVEQISPLPESKPISIENVISDLPQVRSGLSREKDSLTNWQTIISGIKANAFMDSHADQQNREVRDSVIDALKDNKKLELSRGGEFVRCSPKTEYRPDWYIDPRLGGACNHTTKQHMKLDLYRYLFAACFGKVYGKSPCLADFPIELLPKHKNAKKSLADGHFVDRFHVQVFDRPSTTVTSHVAKDGHYFIHPDPCQCRSMTVREVARLQTFPDNYFFCGPRTAQYIQVGNAVPPLLAHQIASSIFCILKECGVVVVG